MMGGNFIHHGLRCIHRRKSTVCSCAVLVRLRILFLCCWHCGDLLCSHRLFLHLGSCWGDVFGLHNLFQCFSFSCHYSVSGMLVGSGRMLVGVVHLASCHMPFVVHNIPSVFVSGGVPFQVLLACSLTRSLLLLLVWTSLHIVLFSLLIMTRHHLLQCMRHLFHIPLVPLLFLHLRQAFSHTCQ